MKESLKINKTKTGKQCYICRSKLKKKILPIWMEISPIAQVALLHTEMNSGFRLVPKMGMKSARKNNIFKQISSHNTIILSQNYNTTEK